MNLKLCHTKSINIQSREKVGLIRQLKAGLTLGNQLKGVIVKDLKAK